MRSDHFNLFFNIISSANAVGLRFWKRMLEAFPSTSGN